MLKNFVQRLQTSEPAPFWPLTTAAAFAAALIVVFIAAQVLAVGLTGSDLTNPAAIVPPLGIAIACLVNTIVVAQWIARRSADGQVIRVLRLFPSGGVPLIVIVLIGLAGAGLIDLIGVLSGLKAGVTVPPAFQIVRDPASSFIGWAIAALTLIVIQPIGEEITFSGLFYPVAARRFGNLAAIGLTSVAYVLFNLLVSGQSTPWYLIAQPLLMALWVTTLRAYTQSTQYAIVGRAAFGLFFVLSALILR